MCRARDRVRVPSQVGPLELQYETLRLADADQLLVTCTATPAVESLI